MVAVVVAVKRDGGTVGAFKALIGLEGVAEDIAVNHAALEITKEIVQIGLEFVCAVLFDKLDLRVATILSCEKHPNADKLLVFQVKMGTERRQIVSGVAAYYKPEELVGKKVVVVANLAPRKLRGVESKGMILFADNVVNGKSRYEYITTVAEDGNSVM